MARKRTYDPTIWMPFYIGDTLADTQHLTTEEFGALILLRAYYWRNQGPIVDDDQRLATVCRLSIERFGKLKPNLAEFYEIYGDKWKSKEFDALIIEAWGFKARASERGKKGAEARWGKKQDDDDGGEEP